MKPRRENGATLVNPMTSDVSTGSALMMDSSWLGAAYSRQIPAKRKSPACENPADLHLRRASAASDKSGSQDKAIKNKAVSAVYRQRPCQPRTLKSALGPRARHTRPADKGRALIAC